MGNKQSNDVSEEVEKIQQYFDGRVPSENARPPAWSPLTRRELETRVSKMKMKINRRSEEHVCDVPKSTANTLKDPPNCPKCFNFYSMRELLDYTTRRYN